MSPSAGDGDNIAQAGNRNWRRAVEIGSVTALADIAFAPGFNGSIRHQGEAGKSFARDGRRIGQVLDLDRYVCSIVKPAAADIELRANSQFTIAIVAPRP